MLLASGVSFRLASDWSPEPGIILPLLVGGALYGWGAVILRRRATRIGVRTAEIAAFATGWLVLALALVSPLHEASEQIFTAHMIQHELLMAVAAPLLILGRPLVVMLWALPHRARHGVASIARSHIVRTAWRALVKPFDAWLLFAVVVWAWHIPALYDATLHSDSVHALQHLSFLGSALLFWWAMLRTRTRAGAGISVVLLFTTAVHTSVLGALMTFSRTPWYSPYATSAAVWGLTPIEDQQLAGLIMWIPLSVVYLVAALAVARRWLSDSESTVAQRQHAIAAAAAR